MMDLREILISTMKDRDHVWSYDFVHNRTDDDRAFRTLNTLDELTQVCLASRKAKAQLDGSHRRPDRPVHSEWLLD